MSAMTYNPWQIFDALGREAVSQHTNVRKAEAAWTPTVDISEQVGAYLIAMDVPGIEAKEIEISAEKNVLKIEGKRVQADNEEGVRFVRRERASGSFARSFQLPENANLSTISAKYNNGELLITVPKQEEPAAVKIEVQH